MNRIRIHTIPHSEQRYDTVGDWVFNDAGDLDIYVSDMGDPNAEFLCAMHELTEVWLCKLWGISQKRVDNFDKKWKGYKGNPDEPGCDPRAPYHKAHEAGEVVERVLASLMGIDWHEYNKSYDKLG